VRVDKPYDYLEELLAEKNRAPLLKARREAELEHARKLAAIRAEPHGPVWTGTAEQLIAAVTHWYESGWIVAKNLEDALRRVGAMLVREDGSPVLTQSSVTASSQVPTAPKTSLTRREFILPLLEQRGWSILDWANEAGVSHTTVHDYLENRRSPFPSTRLKLAKSLGVSIQSLPR
jgi:lambda repressor-like predicted transcriptional regulator